MGAIQWSDSFSVQVLEIDNQHKKLITLIADLETAMSSGKGKDVLGKIVNELTQYTLNHFSTEEKYFDMFKYPDAATHKMEHKKFVEQVSKFKKDFEEGRIGLSIKIMEFLGSWLKNHIQGVDKKYGPFLNQKGLK